jgi:hypothetical protein
MALLATAWALGEFVGYAGRRAPRSHAAGAVDRSAIGGASD